MADQLIRATAASGGIRAVGVITTDLTAEAQRKHGLSFVATTALGRSMAAGLLLASSMKKEGSRVNLRIRSAGPLGGLMVDAGLDGTVRGYVEHPAIEIEPNANGLPDVGRAIGPGYLHVMRDVGYGQPYTSTVELVNGEIGDDVAYYLASSEQTPSAIMLGVYLDRQGVEAAGGLLIQVLPQAARDPALVSLLESRISHLKGFTQLLQSGKDLPEILNDLLGDLDLTILAEPRSLRFFCPCTHQRMLGALKIFGAPELRDMIAKDQGAEATCEFCSEVYQASVEELEGLISDLETAA
ncbi:Hsp33 family molecular chaperone HslO [Synechococcus elongatus]|uniref:33 kDa chaperonin n=1 Tax=Synechococcus elongatus PCC 11801 TaxID=2219813 RepID=A0AAN1QL80_SYNEL|nr:Hsp33 family molecular chaperone HslO [Synechococcus elongatus]AZB71345.1 Hsp33 family molecular chaperone HslO [Synechococcus elongatus PCC 11801]